jgi:hypothetical protein
LNKFNLFRRPTTAELLAEEEYRLKLERERLERERKERDEADRLRKQKELQDKLAREQEKQNKVKYTKVSDSIDRVRCSIILAYRLCINKQEKGK